MRLRGLNSVPFVLYRSGTSRGPYLLASDLPASPAPDRLLPELMGSGHPQQLEGFGGGCGPTSKAVVVGPGPEPGSCTFQFFQCRVEDKSVDPSHGDCGNMLAAVAPFAIERGLVALPDGPDGLAEVHIHSLNTGAVYRASVRHTDGAVEYDGQCVVPGVPSAGSPVRLSSLGVAGARTGALLPTGNRQDSFSLLGGLELSATLIDFGRPLVILDGSVVLPHFGFDSLDRATKPALEANQPLNSALEQLRRAASQAMGMGDCTGLDSPKLALVASTGGPALRCWYWVSPERPEVHPALAMTAGQALAAARMVSGSVPFGLADGIPDGLEFKFAHAKGTTPITIETTASEDTDTFPAGEPIGASYVTTVLPLAEGRALFRDGIFVP